MAKVTVSVALLEDVIFGFAQNPVRIMDVRRSDSNTLEFVIEGDDVPREEEVVAKMSCRQNRAGQKFSEMWFEPVKREPLPEGLNKLIEDAFAALVADALDP